MTALGKLAVQPPSVALYAHRTRVYPKDVSGPVRGVKWAVLVLCLAVYYALPWLRWNRGASLPDQALLLDIYDERFYVFDLVLWPQDIYLLTGLMICAALGLFLVTSVSGRLWCGFSCPQTVWTDLFMLVERKLEGDRNARMKRDGGPATVDRALRKIAKHGVWLFIAFWTGGAWTMYYVDAPHAVREFWTGSASTELYIATGILTCTTYLLAGWAREQVCTYMCPWPRFQSAMLDEQTFIVTYEGWRGEPRGHGRRLHSAEHAPELGDCVDCHACVNVCPTGIDIRDGLQLECISCGLCVDACNEVMRKTGSPPWLITWDTLAGQAARREGKPRRLRLLRPRTLINACGLLLALSTVAVGLITRPRATLALIHDRAPLFVRLKDGSLRNGFTLKIANKTEQAATFSISVSGLPGAQLMLSESSPKTSDTVQVRVSRSEVAGVRLLVQANTAAESVPIVFSLRDEQTGAVLTETSRFIGEAP